MILKTTFIFPQLERDTLCLGSSLKKGNVYVQTFQSSMITCFKYRTGRMRKGNFITACDAQFSYLETESRGGGGELRDEGGGWIGGERSKETNTGVSVLQKLGGAREVRH